MDRILDMPNLIQINISANFGSTGKITEQIAAEATARGCKCYQVYSYGNPSKLELIPTGGKLNRLLHYAEQRIFDDEGLASRLVTRKVIRQIRQIGPDVIQLHNIHDHYLNYRILFEYLNKSGIPVVWTFHDSWGITGHCFHPVPANCSRWKEEGCHDCPLRHKYPNNLLDRSTKNFELKRRLFSACENLTIVGCSEWQANFVRQSFLKDKTIKVIHNGIDINKFKPSSSERSGGKFKILGVALPWVKEKGIDDFFRLRATLSQDEYEIIMVGLTKEQLATLPAGIRGIERTQNVEELVALYNEADVLLNTTYADNYPTVNLEAMACGTPVITYRTGGSPEAVDENTGIVVEQGDFDGLCGAIEEIRGNGKVHYSAACRDRAERLFDKEKCFKEYVELYDTLILKTKI